MKKKLLRRLTAATAVSVGMGASSAMAQPFGATGGQVNGSGATLLFDLFTQPANTNDFIDADGDGCTSAIVIGCPIVDQLSPSYVPNTPLNQLTTPFNVHWLFQYRSVGSVNGFEEFVLANTCGDISGEVPAEGGLLNRTAWAAQGTGKVPGIPQADCVGAPGTADDSGTPLCHNGIDFASIDVQGKWVVRNGDPNIVSGAWDTNPGALGYGINPIVSNTYWDSTLEDLGRDCVGNDGIKDTFLNTDTGTPDASTIFDNPVTWGPITYIANRRTGVENVEMTDLQHLFVSGRLKSGENLVGATRSSGSGTRNGIMNTSGIDTVWGRGDNVGVESGSSSDYILGPDTWQTNCGGSSNMEAVVENWNLAIGYTGFVGSSRSAADAGSGKYELVNVKFDDRGGTQFVRPSVDSVLDNNSPDTGYQLGGEATFVTLGTPDSTNNLDPEYMGNQNAADYLRNITASTASVLTLPGDPANDGTPGEFLAFAFIPNAALEHIPSPSPGVFTPNAGFNAAIQTLVRNNNDLGAGLSTPSATPAPYGSVNPAGRTPNRTLNPEIDAVPGPDKYTDGSGIGTTNYCYSTGGTGKAQLAPGSKLGSRNDLAGDANNDGKRDAADVVGLVQAFFNPRGFHTTPSGASGDQSANTAIPEVIFDFDGDGDFTEEDLRYWMDGLHLDTVSGKLNRKAGAIAIDNAILANHPAAPVLPSADWLPWGDPLRTIVVPPALICDPPTYLPPSPTVDSLLDPFLATGAPYAPGDFRGDVAGSVAPPPQDPQHPRQPGPAPGAAPLGHDGKVDANDIDYVWLQIENELNNLNGNQDGVVDWSNLDEAVYADLSCDMDGDMDIDLDDITELVEVILKTNFGDVDLDGDVDNDDKTIINNSIATPPANPGWADGDVNCDGVVDALDVDVWTANQTGGGAPVLEGISSVRTHGAAGPLSLALPAAPVASEPRQNGAAPRMVFDFDANIEAVDGSADCGVEVIVTNGTCNSVSIAADKLTVNMTYNKNQCVAVAVTGLRGAGGGAPVLPATGRARTIEGDADDTKSINILDLANIKNNLFQPVNGTTLRFDIDCTGLINILDLANTKNNLFAPQPACP